MRWPWQRERPGTAPTAPVAASEPPPSPMGWAFLAPLQRVVGEPALITRPREFPHTLPAWRDPTFANQGMTHVVSPEAPSGLIDGDGKGAPVQRAAATELPLRPRQKPAPVPRQRLLAATRSFTQTSTESLPVLQLATVEDAAEQAVDPTEQLVVEQTDKPNDAAPTLDAAPPLDQITPPMSQTSPPASLQQRAEDPGAVPPSATEPPTTPVVRPTTSPDSSRRPYGLGAPLPSNPTPEDGPAPVVQPSRSGDQMANELAGRASPDHARCPFGTERHLTGTATAAVC